MSPEAATLIPATLPNGGKTVAATVLLEAAAADAETIVCKNSGVNPSATPTPKPRRKQAIATMGIGPGIPQMDTTCYYQEVTPGVEDPAHDIFLGCDYVDFYGSEVSNGGQPGYDPGVHGGGPTKLAGKCSSAPNDIGDPVIPHGTTDQGTVIDRNSVWAAGQNIGWIYDVSIDGVTERYAQVNSSVWVNAGPSYSSQQDMYNYVMTTYFGFPKDILGSATQNYDTGLYKISPTQTLKGGARALKCYSDGEQLG